MKLLLMLILSIAFLGVGPASAGDFDGSKVLICAPVEVSDCAPGETCKKGAPADVGVPAFIRIDIAKMAVIGPKRTTPDRLHREKPTTDPLAGDRVGLRVDTGTQPGERRNVGIFCKPRRRVRSLRVVYAAVTAHEP
jgi:hypothetical protein